ncbi:MAG: type II secretion system protein GspJ [Myxococcota bacterium]
MSATSPASRRRRARGFSIMEILIAATLLSIMGALLWSSFSSTLDSKERIEAATDRMDELRLAMSRMANEISHAFISQHYWREERRTKTLFKEGGSGIGDRLTFSAFTHQPMVANANESDQAIIAFYVDTDPDNGSQSALFRSIKRRIDEDPEHEEGALEEVLCTNVQEVRFEYWNEALSDWRDTWDTEGVDTPNVLPRRVRITLTAKDETNREVKLTTQTSILLWQILAF